MALLRGHSRGIGQLGVAALILILGSCHGRFDELRMRVDASEQGALTAQLSQDIPTNQADLQNSATYSGMNNFAAQLTERCNVRHVLFPRENRLRLDLRAAFTDIDDLNSTLNCSAFIFREPRVEFERTDGFLWNTFVVRFFISEMNGACPATGSCAPSSLFPRVILLTVPGKIHRIENNSTMLGIDVHPVQDDDDTMRVTIAAMPDYRAQNLRYFANRRDRSRRDELRIEVTSRVANFNLSTILSVIGMIFGSGLLIQASRFFLFRPKEAKPAG